MYEALRNYFKNDITNTVIFHNETDTDYIADIIKETVLPVHSKIYTDRDEEKTFLALKFPADGNEISLFMDSPLNFVEYYKKFKGVFVVDLSDYAYDWKSDNINRLLEYISSSNKEMVFVLLMACSVEERERVFHRFESKLSIDKFELPGPDENELREYLVNSIKSKNYILSEETAASLEYLIQKEYEMDKITSFGDADAVISKITRILVNNAEADADVIFDEMKRYSQNRKTEGRKTIGF